MKSSLVAMLLPAAASARFVETPESGRVLPVAQGLFDENAQAQPLVQDPEKFLVELSPGDTKWVTEDQKWELRRVSLLAPMPVSSPLLPLPPPPPPRFLR